MTALVESQAVEPESLEDEIAALVKLLRPREFDARLAMWTRGNLPGGMSTDLVKSSRAAKLPALDRMDQTIERDRGRYADAIWDAGRARTRGDLKKARRLLQSAVAIQETWLYDIEVASETMQELAGDESCEGCGQTRSQYEFRKPKTRWGKRRGLAPCCYQTWLEWEKPDLLVFKARIAEVRDHG